MNFSHLFLSVGIKEENLFPNSIIYKYIRKVLIFRVLYDIQCSIKNKTGGNKKSLTSRLFYWGYWLRKVIPQGFEPWTHSLEGCCSNPTELRNLKIECKVTHFQRNIRQWTIHIHLVLIFFNGHP